MDYRQLLVNKMMTPDGTILESYSTHDAKYHIDKNGNTYMNDGGLDYIHRIQNGDEVDLSIYTDDPHEKIRDNFTWGTRGKSGKSKLKWILLKDLETDHIENIIKTQTRLPDFIKKVFTDELEFRKNNYK